jgi:hypothetical protein
MQLNKTGLTIQTNVCNVSWDLKKNVKASSNQKVQKLKDVFVIWTLMFLIKSSGVKTPMCWKNVIKIKCRLVFHYKFNTEEVIFCHLHICLKKPFNGNGVESWTQEWKNKLVGNQFDCPASQSDKKFSFSFKTSKKKKFSFGL